MRDHFRQLMDPIWQQWGTPSLNMCAHVQYTFYRHEGQLRLCLSLSFPPSLSLHLQCVSKAWRTLDCVGSFVFSFIWIFSLVSPRSPISRSLVDIRGACSFSHRPLQHTVDGGFLSCGHELDTVTSFHLCLKECDTCGLPFEFSLFLPTSILSSSTEFIKNIMSMLCSAGLCATARYASVKAYLNLRLILWSSCHATWIMLHSSKKWSILEAE